jgi:hypothetical protein
MDLIDFLYVSPGSRTVQLHDSLGIRCACACSEAGFSFKMATVLEECITKEHRFVVHSLRAKGLTVKDIHKEMLTV